MIQVLWVLVSEQQYISVDWCEWAQGLTAFHAIRCFDQMVTLTRILGVFILFCKVTSGGKNWGLVSKSYIILHNSGSRFELAIFTTFWKIDGFEKFKMVTGSM